jgi:ribosomal protein L24E
MVKCAYCNTELKKGTGIMYVYRTGDIAYYDTNKCFKNHIKTRRGISKKLVVKEAKVVKAVEKK